MNYLPDAALFLALTLALVAAGWCFTPTSRSGFEAAFVPGAAFLGAYAWLIWVVGSVWQLVPALWCALPWPLLAIAMVIKRRNLAHHARRAFVSLQGLQAPDQILTLYLCALFALTFALSLALPGAADYDSLVYHLAVPAQYLRAGRVIELPYDHHSYFPMSLEMLYALGLHARGAVFAKLFHWLMLPLGALALLALGKRVASARGGLLGACLYASTPLILQESLTAYIDLGFAAFAFLAVLCLSNALETRAQSDSDSNSASDSGSKARFDLALCGAFCGFSLGTKYFGALIFGFLGLWLLFADRKRNSAPRTAASTAASHDSPATPRISRRAALQRVLIFAFPALLFGGFWYLRNVIWTGNPVFPFAFGVFGGSGWNAEMARLYDESQAIYGFGKTPLDALWLPWRLAMAPLGYGQPFWPLAPSSPPPPLTGAFEVPGLLLSSLVGPALLALGIPALFIRKKPRPIALASAMFVFLLVFWFVTSQQIRYLIPALGLLALLGGWGAVELAPRLKSARLLGALLLAAWFAFTPFWLIGGNRNAHGVILGAQTEADYLRRAAPGYDAMQYANQTTPKNAKFAVFGEPRCFYLDRDYFWADDPHNNLIDYSKIKSAAAFAAALRALGATHVLWNTDPGRNGGVFGPPQPLMDEAIAAGELILETDRRGYRVYRVDPLAK